MSGETPRSDDMTHGLAVVVAVVVGLLVGLGAGRLPAQPIVQTVVAALAALFLAPVVAAGIWLLRPPADAGVVAVSFGLAEGLITSAVVVTLAIVVHAFLGWLGVVTYRALIIGVLAALSGAAAATLGIGLGHALK